MVRVFVKLEKLTASNSIVPPLAEGPNPKNGARGTSASIAPEPPIIQRVTVQSSTGDSASFAFAARPVTWIVFPARFGISNCNGLAFVTAPKRQPDSATTKKLLPSGSMSQG